ncbi:MerR family transcriptional regulator [Streptomyces sp. NPDC056347]|uniref:MerR family transcriptional regulator n=1 Tax=Streptomyces sp. NPDC056347 TaxID=3345790 RepID=UPI0035DE3ACF
MDGDTLLSIGELARRTGLTVRTIRFYSDRGIVAPTDRSPAGYRRYHPDAVERLRLVRTLRDLDVDLPTVRRVVDRELTLPEVAATHAEALAVRIRVLRLRQAVLTVVAEHGLTAEETDLMHTLTQLSEDERGRLTEDFLDAVFGGAGELPVFAAARRSLTPEIPDSPGAEQVRAWAEWAGLAADPDFRASMRRTVEDHTAELARRGNTAGPRRDVVAVVRERAAPALAAGVDPASHRADAVVAAVAAHHARTLGRADGPEVRRLLLDRLERAGDPRRDRYAQLLAVINGWPAPESLAPVLDWAARAVRARTEP